MTSGVVPARPAVTPAVVSTPARWFTDVSAVRIPPGPRGSTTQIVAQDTDSDGDVDLAFAQGSGQNLYYSNDGNGKFTGTTALPARVDNSLGIAFADLDSDGDPDLAVANGNDLFGDSVLFNRYRHLRAPLLIRRGRDFNLQLELAGEPVFLVGAGVLGTQSTVISLPPFGVWRVQFQGSARLPLVYIPPLARSATLRIAVPTSPSLRGIAVYFQFVFVHPAGASTISNVVAETVP